MEKKVALSIAGSDPSGGAGIQADLKAFTLLRLHGTTVITCLTAQNTRHVKTIYKVPLSVIEDQIDTLHQDFPIAAVKTGMLYDEEIIQCISRKIKQYKIKPVVDPVMISTSGDALSTNTFIRGLKKHLLPKTYILTANIPEAEALLGVSLKTQHELENACKKLYDLGPKHVLLKGGHHQSDDALDYWYDGTQISGFSLPRIPKKKVRGTGCTLSALITGYLALGEPVKAAIEKTKFLLWNMIHEAVQLGHDAEFLGHAPTFSVDKIPLLPTQEHFCVWLEVKTAVGHLRSLLPPDFIPEVGINIGYALPYATRYDEICAIEGRLVRTGEHAECCGRIAFGVSKHIASIVLTVMSFDPTFRCACNLRYSEQILDRCKKAGLQIGSFDRADEPSAASSTMEWGTRTVITTHCCIPDIIYDTGAKGKEPMIRILGRTPQDVLDKIRRILS
ncbi:MAG: bifunctional hydroxymethylpyrimidine kinase/phosphomethylpyrimidine kinase [Methanobacteriota archaeon]